MKAVFCAVALMIVTFLLFAFYNVTFSIQYWSPDSRMACAMFMVGAGFVGAILSGLSDI